jgi:hypothetical protein
MTRDEKEQLALMLNRPLEARFARCPAKSRQKVLALKRKTGVDHSPESHYCHECACGYIAGHGTDHLGYGWCFNHEKGADPEQCREVAERHKLALQQHHPFVYRSPDKFLKEVQEQAVASSKRLDLRAEIDVARSLVQEMVELGRNGELKEYRGEELVEMSDATRMTKLNGLLKTLGSLGIARHNIEKTDMFTKDELNVALGQVFAVSQECVMDPNPDRQEVWNVFVDRIRRVKMPGGVK